MTTFQDDLKTDALFKQVYDELRAMSPDELVAFLQDGETGPIAALIQASDLQTEACRRTSESFSVEMGESESGQHYSWDTNILVEFAKGAKHHTSIEKSGSIAASDSMAKAA